MNGAPKNERSKPLPLRREFWKIMPKLIKNGVVVLPQDEKERSDARAAAFSILIDHQERELIEHFDRPVLTDADLYTEFATKYSVDVTEQESEIWDQMVADIEETKKADPEAPLDEIAAAYLTLDAANKARKIISVHPHSIELYQFLPKFTESYEALLKQKYGDTFTPEMLYAALRKYMPRFLSTFIAQDPVIANLLSINVVDEESLAQKERLTTISARFEPRVMELDANDALRFKKTLLDAIHKHAKEMGITEDSMGRAEDRGCPILYSGERDAVLKFAIEELIAQHELFLQRAQE